jgi:hypothetical protein
MIEKLKLTQEQEAVIVDLFVQFIITKKSKKLVISNPVEFIIEFLTFFEKVVSVEEWRRKTVDLIELDTDKLIRNITKSSAVAMKSKRMTLKEVRVVKK